MLVASTGASMLAWTPEADACGGTFCDAGPQQMPVDQTGETILFVLGDGEVEAHVQIEYDGGDASKFAWIVPVMAIPEIEVGSFALIDNALQATVPVYGLQTNSVCSASDGGGGGFISEPDGGGASSEDPEVVTTDTVGAFEYSILQGGTVDGIGQWLADNAYAEDEQAPEILQSYLDDGAVFVAFKLRHDAGVEDIHPVVIRYPGSEACVPIRLTRIAAVDDMDIRALFLGSSRVFPVNYEHVRLNRTRLDWVGLGVNYPEVVSRAIDEASGRAFVTEYAGTSDFISTQGLDATGLDPAVFEDATMFEVVDILRAQGLMECDETCRYDHPLVRSVLELHLTPPPGVASEVFHACVECYADQIEPASFDGSAFAADFAERIVDPMLHAWDILATWPYVTRLYTRISPHEMLSDPLFEVVPGLGDVPNRSGALQEDDCCDSTVRLPGGREVVLDAGAWPVFSEDMPWAERIEEYQPAGPPSTIVDNSALIDQLLAQSNARLRCEDPGGETTGATSGVPPHGDTGVGATSSSGGASDSDSGGAADDSVPGCSCTAEPGPAPSNVLFGLFGLFGLAAVRRRGRR